MINVYEELVNILMDAFTNQNLESNITVGTTDNLKWEDIIQDENTIYGVLNPTGGSNIKVDNGLLKTEVYSLALALPNNVKDQYFNALEGVKNAIKQFIQVPHEIAGDTYLFGDNGLQTNDFRVVRGKHIGVVTQNLVSSVAGNMLEVTNAIVSIVPSDYTEPTEEDDEEDETSHYLFGMYHYTASKTKNFDPIDLKKDDLQKSAYRSYSFSLVLDYYKIKENALHKLLLSDKPYFFVTLYDGEDTVINGAKMYLSGYTQDGIVGGYTNVKVTLISGVIE